MYAWHVEDMKLMNQKCKLTTVSGEKIYNDEQSVTRDDKIAFVDKMQDGKLSYILALAEKFEKDKRTMPVNKWGEVKTVSLKAWIKRNDERQLITNSYLYGNIRFICGRNIQSINEKDVHDIYKDYVDEVFHLQLRECESLEHKYFLEHDEYSILKKKFLDSKHDTTFGVHIATWSNGNICVVDDNGDRERDITIEELKYLLSKYEELDALIAKITEETHIKY